MFPSKEHVFEAREDREILGQRLELARLRSKLSQLDALEAAGLIEKTDIPGSWTGVTKGFLTYVEKGHRGVTKEQVQKLAKLYGVAVKWLTLTSPLTRAEISELIELRAKIVRGRKPMQLGRTAAPTVQKIEHQLTPGDRAILHSVAECSEPEKLWLTSAIERLIKKVRQPVET